MDNTIDPVTGYALERDYWYDTASKGTELPLPVVEIDMETEWGAWLEATYDPDNERLEDHDL
jgi:hypothetical protein